MKYETIKKSAISGRAKKIAKKEKLKSIRLNSKKVTILFKAGLEES